MGWLSCCECKSKEEKITELDFSRCGISEVPNEVYLNSPTLEVLHLEGNKVCILVFVIVLLEEVATLVETSICLSKYCVNLLKHNKKCLLFIRV